MKKRVLDTIGMIIISIVILTFSLLVGANEKGLRELPMCILLFVALAYLIVRKILLKQKIVIKNKTDLFVLLFMCSTMLPLIFKTYCTLQGTIEFILKYFFVYSMYLVVRNTIDSKGKLEVLASVTIIGSLIVIVLGIDLQHGQYLQPIIKKFNLNYSEDTRFSSTFGYANTVAIYITFCIFSAVHKVQNAKSKIVKALNIIYVFLGFYIVYITISRAVLLLLVAGLLLYYAIYYYSNYKGIFKNKKRIGIIIFIILAIITITICILTKALKYSKPLEVTDDYGGVLRYPFEENQEYEIILDIETLKIENSLQDSSQEEYQYNYQDNNWNMSKNVSQENKPYITERKEKNIEIKIIEENIYRNKTTLASVELENFENFNGTKTLKITPDSNLLRITIEVTTKKNEKIIINKCYINNEETILNYKYIPNQIARLLHSFSFKEGSIDQRLVFYRDCLKIAKDNWLIGQGGNTWKKMSLAVQEYQYNIKETHSYFFELLISYGIVGVGLFLALFIGLNIKLIREYKNNSLNSKNEKSNIKNNTENNTDSNNNKQNKKYYKLAILIGLDILILHSLCFDFNMSFLIINLIVFMYIAALMYNSQYTFNVDSCNVIQQKKSENKNTNNKKINKNKKEKLTKAKCKIIEIVDYIVFVILAIVLATLICGCIAKYCVEDETIKKNLAPYNSKYTFEYINLQTRNTQNYKQIIEEIQKLIQNEPYYNQNELYEKYCRLILMYNIKSDKLAEYLQFINHQYKTAKIATPMKINSVMVRAKTMANTYIELKEKNYSNEKILEQIEQLRQIINEEYKINIINIKAKERNGLEQETIDKYEAEYTEILEKIE